MKIYGVQCHERKNVEYFYRDISRLTGGRHLKLSEFSTIVDMMMAICYREHGAEFFDAYEHEVRARDGAGMRQDLDHMFGTLRDDTPDAEDSDESEAPVVKTTKPHRTTKPRTPGGAAKKAGARRTMPAARRAAARRSPRKPAAAVTPVASPRTTSSSENDSTTSSVKGYRTGVKVGVVTRGQKHQMDLRMTPARTASHKVIKKAKRVSVIRNMIC